jgi:DNA replication protein DnaC
MASAEPGCAHCHGRRAQALEVAPAYVSWCRCPFGRQLLAAWQARDGRRWAAAFKLQYLDALDAARLPDRYRDWSWRTARQAGVDAAAIATVQRWVRAHLYADTDATLLLVGPTGVGKTGLAACATKPFAAKLRQDVQFWRVSELLDALRREYDRPSAAREVWPRLQEPTLLVLDDLAAEPLTEWASERLALLLDTRRDNGYALLCVTTNYPPAELARRAGERLVGRLLEDATVVPVTGRNLRLPPPA